MLIARGAAVLCADCQRGIDIVIPFTYDDPKLGRRNISAVLIQVKNDAKYSSTPYHYLFDGMSPFSIGLYDKNDSDLHPVIRMVFALSTLEIGVSIIEQSGSHHPRQAKVSSTSTYTAYDILCAGASSSTFSVINTDEKHVYQKLLKVCSIFPMAYESEVPLAAALRKSMNPGAGTNADHWTPFSFEE